MTRYIVRTASETEHEVWQQGGYWKINFKGKDRFIAMLVSSDGSSFVHFNEINKDSFAGKIVVSPRNDRAPNYNSKEKKGLELGWNSGLFPRTNVVTAIREKN